MGILVVDTGSSSMRGILFDKAGQMRFTEQRKYCMDTSADGVAEYDPAVFQVCLTGICAACAQRAADCGEELEAISFTSQRSSILPLGADGTPLDRIMTWYDKRSAHICGEIRSNWGEEIYAIAGMLPTPVLSAPKMTWLRRNKPEVYHAAHKIVGIHDYLIYLCTGNLVTDVTLASRTNLMDARTLTWSDRLLEIFEVDRDKLAPLLPACSVAGRTTMAFESLTGVPAGTPVVSGGGDQQCSVLGQGLSRPGAVGITCGSGAYLAVLTDRPVFDPDMRVNLNAAVTPGHWILEASTFSTGTVQDWFIRTFYGGDLDRMYAELAESLPGAGGVLMLPDLAGKGCPDWDDYAHGTFYNLGFSTTRGDCARAMLEGLAAEIAECHGVLRQLVPTLEEVSITGGLSKASIFNQIIADMIDFLVKKCNNEETTAMGAYLAAVVALGIFATPEEAYSVLFGSQKEGERYIPIPENTAVYRQANRARRALYESIPGKTLTHLLSFRDQEVFHL